jgi:hypothetical protein
MNLGANMRRVFIQQKLEEIECPVESLVLGDFDKIGEFTAKKSRSPNDPLYKTAGCYFRPNYERGLLIYSLIKRFEIKTFFEIGFGRGYGALCAAKAMVDMCWDDAKVYSIDPNIDDNHLKVLSQVFPKDLLGKVNLVRGVVDDALKSISGPFDMVYIDGDHRYSAVKHDWECLKDKFSKFCLFDDYDEKTNKDIEVKKLIDEIELEKELIIGDRRVFFDDRRIADEDINYGQVLLKHPNFDATQFLTAW